MPFVTERLVYYADYRPGYHHLAATTCSLIVFAVSMAMLYLKQCMNREQTIGGKSEEKKIMGQKTTYKSHVQREPC